MNLYQKIQNILNEKSSGKNGAHISGVSTVTLADYLMSIWFFEESQEMAWANSLEMAVDILTNQIENNASDVNANAVQFITDWILKNPNCFANYPYGTRFGFINQEENVAYILPSVLNQALQNAGYTPQKVRNYLAEQDLILTSTDKDGKKRFTISKRLPGEPGAHWLVAFRLDALNKSHEPKNQKDDANFELPF